MVRLVKERRKYAGSVGASDERCRATVHSLSKVRPRIRRTSERTTRRNPLGERALDEAADGTRTHDLLHGNQYVKARFPAPMRVSRRSGCHRIASDYRRFGHRMDTRLGLPPAVRSFTSYTWSESLVGRQSAR